MTAGLRLDELAREIPGGNARIEGDARVRVTGVQQDSRRVAPGDLFVAKKGAHADGAAFVEEAKRRGASAVLLVKGASTGASLGLPALVVDDVADGLAFASAAVYGHPAFGLEIVGVTGTNGKTTTTHLVRAAVDGALGAARCGIVGTVGHRFGALSIDAAHTTPEADELARVLSDMRTRGATHVAMEVSSIALASGRVRAVRFRVAALTNLTQDHLDYHGSMESYAAAKAELFTTSAPGAAVINVDDAFGRSVAENVRAPLVRVSARVDARKDEADIAPAALSVSRDGIRGILRTPRGDVDLRSPLVGMHNVENLVVALGVVHALDLDLAKAAAALADEMGAPGRLERCDSPGDDITVLVDYAHTPDALARALDCVLAVASARVWCVFGCGGDRDAKKRAPMGDAVARRSHLVVVTNDNPRGEDPRAIIAPVVGAIAAAGLEELSVERLAVAERGYLVELDRSRAIVLAISAARAGDVVLVAGKGHEPYQIIGVEKRPFDDRIEARRALIRRRERTLSPAASPGAP